jgi:hypothetical protein
MAGDAQVQWSNQGLWAEVGHKTHKKAKAEGEAE